ncbi:MAG: hypothetical protein Q7V05_10500 [Methanoregula sp.]|nr:hypothetical protein [Methanoregula sp.]
MLLLGLRASPKTIRYAVLDYDGQNARLLNADSENKINFPADLLTYNEKKLAWLYHELTGIFDHYSDIAVVSIKSNEYGPGGQTKASREAAYIEGVMILVAELNGKPVSVKLYSSLKTNSKTVKISAKAIIESVDSLKSFDEKMADAIVVAFSGRLAE